MDKVKECLDRIRVIRGVNYGQISDEQIRTVFEIFDLNEAQRAQVFEQIHDMGIRLISESELYGQVLGKTVYQETLIDDTEEIKDEELLTDMIENDNLVINEVEDDDFIMKLKSISAYVSGLDKEVQQMFRQYYGEDIVTTLANNKVKVSNLENCLEGICRMKAREQKMMVLRFGFASDHPMRLEEVAKLFGVTRERVRQIEGKVFRVHHIEHRKRLVDFL